MTSADRRSEPEMSWWQWNLPPRSLHWFFFWNTALKCAPLRSLRPVVRFKRWLSTDLFTQAFYFMNSNRPCLQSTKSCVLCLQPSFWEFKTVCGSCGLFLSSFYCLNRQNKYIFSCVHLVKPLQPRLSLYLVKELKDALVAICCVVTEICLFISLKRIVTLVVIFAVYEAL